MSTEEAQRAAQLEAASGGILAALDAAGLGEDPGAMAVALGVVLGSLAQATSQGEAFIQTAASVARAAMNGELDT